MHYIAHRRNLLSELLDTPTEYGIEVDIRSKGNQLIIHHDPFEEGNDFLEWIAEYRHGTLILNVKEEGLEARLIDIMSKRGIENYFFLDQSFPFLIKWSKQGLRRSAVRLSEFETIETALTLAGKIDWVWVDCFSKFPLTAEQGRRLNDAGFKLCLVSPELQGREAETHIPKMHALVQSLNIRFDAVCTKQPEIWKQTCTP